MRHDHPPKHLERSVVTESRLYASRLVANLRRLPAWQRLGAVICVNVEIVLVTGLTVEDRPSVDKQSLASPICRIDDFVPVSMLSYIVNDLFHTRRSTARLKVIKHSHSEQSLQRGVAGGLLPIPLYSTGRLRCK